MPLPAGLQSGVRRGSLSHVDVPAPPSLPLQADSSAPTPSVQVFGRKKTATAVSYCKAGKGLLKINGMPLNLLQPALLREKVCADARFPRSGGGRDGFCIVRCACVAL